jgi:hypothetical protein
MTNSFNKLNAEVYSFRFNAASSVSRAAAAAASASSFLRLGALRLGTMTDRLFFDIQIHKNSTLAALQLGLVLQKPDYRNGNI